MAAGGTELIHAQLMKRLPEELLDKVNVISRPSNLDPDKKNVLWVHDLPNDVAFLAEKRERQKFDGIVFVSSWQQTIFNLNMGIPFSESVVIKNAIDPIPINHSINNETIRLVYHPTPHRGLEILVPTFMRLCERYPNIHLDVFSNFDIYGWPDLNKNFEHLYEICRSHPQITYHGTQPNEVVRNALSKSHIFAYPCIWRETSCMAAMEAMSAKCLIVAPDYGALPETLANFNVRYNWTENMRIHADRFYQRMCSAIESIGSLETNMILMRQKEYADVNYSWYSRIDEWIEFLGAVAGSEKKRPSITWING